MFLEGKTINLRTVESNDAEFIYEMRNNVHKTKYLSTVHGTVQDQIDWIVSYKEREKEQKEFYFLIESKEGEKLGLVRVYDLRDNSFCWGSWLIKEGSPKTTAIESAMQIYEFGFYNLGFRHSHFDVRKENIKVIKFHQRFGAKIVNENELDYFFSFNIDDYEKIKTKYVRYL